MLSSFAQAQHWAVCFPIFYTASRGGKTKLRWDTCKPRAWLAPLAHDTATPLKWQKKFIKYPLPTYSHFEHFLLISPDMFWDVSFLRHLLSLSTNNSVEFPLSFSFSLKTFGSTTASSHFCWNLALPNSLPLSLFLSANTVIPLSFFFFTRWVESGFDGWATDFRFLMHILKFSIFEENRARLRSGTRF